MCISPAANNHTDCDIIHSGSYITTVNLNSPDSVAYYESMYAANFREGEQRDSANASMLRLCYSVQTRNIIRRIAANMLLAK